MQVSSRGEGAHDIFECTLDVVNRRQVDAGAVPLGVTLTKVAGGHRSQSREFHMETCLSEVDDLAANPGNGDEHLSHLLDFFVLWGVGDSGSCRPRNARCGTTGTPNTGLFKVPPGRIRPPEGGPGLAPRATPPQNPGRRRATTWFLGASSLF